MNCTSKSILAREQGPAGRQVVKYNPNLRWHSMDFILFYTHLLCHIRFSLFPSLITPFFFYTNLSRIGGLYLVVWLFVVKAESMPGKPLKKKKKSNYTRLKTFYKKLMNIYYLLYSRILNTVWFLGDILSKCACLNRWSSPQGVGTLFFSFATHTHTSKQPLCMK